MPTLCEEILQRFLDNGYEGFLVGGCVRDTLLGKTPLDWDICTSALPEETIALFKDYKVILTGLKHGTVTILKEKMAVEVTTYRIDGEYLDNRRPKEVFFTKDLVGDLSRRDFTINAMAYNHEKGLIDCFGGLEDLKSGLIRAVGNAEERYHEDGLRLMRAVRFACVLNFDYEEKTKAAILSCNHLLKNIALERIQIELNKILRSSYAAKGLADLYHLGCFMYFLPEICHTYGFEQNNPYHCYDVFGHTLKSVESIENDLILRLTMLLHDIAKPFTWCACYGDSDCFPDHERLGKIMAETILKRLHYDKATIKEVCQLIRFHTYMIKPEAESVRRALSLLGESSFWRLLKVKRADILAQLPQHFSHHLAIFDKIEAIAREVLASGVCLNLRQLALTGEDLLQLGYKGAQIGEKLAMLLDYVLTKPESNNREDLMELLREEGYKDAY